MTLELLFAFLATFFALKAIEHRDAAPPLGAATSILAWVCAGIAVVLVIAGS